MKREDIINKKNKDVFALARSEAFGAGIANAVINPIVALLIYPASCRFELGVDLFSDTLITCIVLSVCVAFISPLAAKRKIALVDNFAKLPKWAKFIPSGNFKRAISTGLIAGVIFCALYAVYFFAFQIQSISFCEFECVKAVYTGGLGYFVGLSSIYAQFKKNS